MAPRCAHHVSQRASGTRVTYFCRHAYTSYKDLTGVKGRPAELINTLYPESVEQGILKESYPLEYGVPDIKSWPFVLHPTIGPCEIEKLAHQSVVYLTPFKFPKPITIGPGWDIHPRFFAKSEQILHRDDHCICN